MLVFSTTCNKQKAKCVHSSQTSCMFSVSTKYKCSRIMVPCVLILGKSHYILRFAQMENKMIGLGATQKCTPFERLK